MKKINLVLIISGVLLAFASAGYADTSAPKAPSAPTAPSARTAPGVSKPSTPDVAPSTDADARKNEANLQAAMAKCNAIVDTDSKTKCMNDAETNYANKMP